MSLTAPLVIHIFVPLSTYEPSGCFFAVDFIPRTSVPACGSDIPMPPIAAPLHAAGSHRAFCSALPCCARLLTKSCECARYDRQNAGSEYESSSWTMHAAAASIPAPPYSGSTVTPSSPSSPHLRKSAALNRSARLCSNACGSTSSVVNARTISRSAACSGVGSKRDEGSSSAGGCAAAAAEERARREEMEEAGSRRARRSERRSIITWRSIVLRRRRQVPARQGRESAEGGHVERPGSR